VRIGYEFEVARARPDEDARRRVEAEIEWLDGVEVELGPAGGRVAVALGSDDLLGAAWRVLEILARAGYAIWDLQFARPVVVDEDWDDVRERYAALARLPGR
jgi:hypothetical protein